MTRERVPLAVGQVWREHDSRFVRRVRIIEAPSDLMPNGAVIEGVESGKRTRALLRRFGGRGWGAYRYHDEDNQNQRQR